MPSGSIFSASITGCFAVSRSLRFLLCWLLLWFPFSFGASVLVGDPFLAGMAGLPAAFLVALMLGRFLDAKQEAAKLMQFQLLLSFLSARVASGQTLEHALTEAAPALEQELGPSNRLVRSLIVLRRQLQAQMQIDAVLAGFAKRFGSARISAQLSALVPLSRHGGRLDLFLRRSHDALNKERRMQADVTAARSQTTSETLVLLVLPFVLASAMSGEYRGELAKVPWQQAALLLIFAITVLAVIAAVAALTPERPRHKPEHTKKATKKPLTRTPRLLSHIYLKWLPGGLGHRLQKAAERTGGPDGFLRHLGMKRRLFMLSGILTAWFAVTLEISPFVYPLLYMLPCLLHDLDLRQKESICVQSYRLDLPIVLNLLVTSLESGLTLDTALAHLPVISDASVPGSCGQAMRQVRQKLALGQTADSVLTELADLCPIPDLASALHLAARYARQGGSELISLLSVTANDSWQEYRLALQKKLERRSLYLMIPMGLDLLAVILVAVLPAIASLSTF